MSELLSVIVPVYNMGVSLEKCVASILSQEDADFELILVDDGSKDDSWERCLRMQERDSRVRAYHQENQGPGPARNTGIEHANGRWAYFPDADDTLSPRAFRIMLDAIEKNGADLLVFGYQAIDQKGEVRRHKTYPELVFTGEHIRNDYAEFAGLKTKYGIQGAPWNKLFDMNLIRAHTIRYLPLRRYEDEAFITDYMCYAEKVQFIEDVLYTYYMNDLALEWKKFPDDYANIVMTFQEHRKRTVLSWNPADQETLQIATEDYVDGIVRALELFFSPKYTYSNAEIKKLVIETVEKADICVYPIYSDYSIYKKVLLHLLKRKLYGLSMLGIRFKIWAEKRGLDRASHKYNE